MFIPTLLLLEMTGSALIGQIADAPLVAGSTSKSMHEFEACFVSIQQAQSRPLWLVPHEQGGRISNEGTDGVRNPYQIRFTEAAGHNLIEAFIGRRGEPEERPLIEAIKSCW